MRHPASEKHGTIRLVEGSYLPVKRTLGKLGTPLATHFAARPLKSRELPASRHLR